MVERIVEQNKGYKIYITSLFEQIFVTASIEDNSKINVIDECYNKIAEILANNKCQITQERCFGNIDSYKKILDIRNRVFSKKGIETETPFTYIEGRSCIGYPLAGIQIRAIKTDCGINVQTIVYDNKPKGRKWVSNATEYLFLQGITDERKDLNDRNGNRNIETEMMFKQVENILNAEGITYREVIRTWLYLSDILDWYNDFNEVRNSCYAQFRLINHVNPDNAEQIYLPASTGIEGKNPLGTSALMDALAVHRLPGSKIQIRHINSGKQRSPFRYGSAFSRAVVVEDEKSKLIYISGTASINEDGKSVFIGDIDGQIKYTMSVVSAIAAKEGATVDDICEATVFLKNREYYVVFNDIINELGLKDLCSVNVVADVCRDELLFEIDATLIVSKEQ